MENCNSTLLFHVYGKNGVMGAMEPEKEDYLFVKELNFFTKELIAQCYDITSDKIINIVYFDPAHAAKSTMVRPVVSGAPGETDVYGAQQHAPLLALKIPVKEAS